MFSFPFEANQNKQNLLQSHKNIETAFLQRLGRKRGNKSQCSV